MISAKRIRFSLFDALVYTVVTLISIVMVYPFLYIVAVSLSDPAEIYGMNITFFPKGLQFDLYKYIFQLPTVYRGYANSFLYASTGTVLSLLFTVLCAYPLSKKWLPGRSFLVQAIVITMFVNGGLIPLYLLVKELHLYNTMFALIFPGLINTFYMFIALAFFRGIPVELEEASHIDGAGDWRILFSVFLPLSKPILATLTLFYVVGYWNAWFPAAIFLSDASKYPIQLVLRNMMAGTGIGPQEMTMVLGDTIRSGAVNLQALNYALIVAVILPIIFMYPLLQKYFIKGAMIGSLKG